jgi:co-chaperonin GroES (HSP10)
MKRLIPVNGNITILVENKKKEQTAGSGIILNVDGVDNDPLTSKGRVLESDCEIFNPDEIVYFEKHAAHKVGIEGSDDIVIVSEKSILCKEV